MPSDQLCGQTAPPPEHSFLLPSSYALPWRGVWGEQVESCSTPCGLHGFLCCPRILTSPAGRLEQPGMSPVAYWLCDHCLFAQPWNEALGFWHSRDPYQPISTLSSQLFAVPRLLLHVLLTPLPSALPPCSPKCPAFYSAPPAFTDLLKLQSSTEVTSVGFLCTVYILPGTGGRARECMSVYYCSLGNDAALFLLGALQTEDTPAWNLISLFLRS